MSKLTWWQRQVFKSWPALKRWILNNVDRIVTITVIHADGKKTHYIFSDFLQTLVDQLKLGV